MYELPYGNTQQLNLDWFIKRWQEFYTQWQETEAGIDHALDAEVQRVEDAMTDLYAARDAAEASATAAAASATSASNDATIAANAATAAAASATLANTKATAAGLSEAAAALSASQAANDATAAATSASQASASASSATDSAQAAAASATAADSSADDAADSATAAAGSATAAAGSASDAADSATAAAASAASLVVDSAMSDSSTNPVQNKVINGELTELKTALHEDQRLESGTINFTISGTGGLVATTGEVGGNPSYSQTDYIDVSGFHSLIYKRIKIVSTSSSVNFGMAFYNAEKQYVYGVIPRKGQNANGYAEDIVAVPDSAKYARFSTWTSSDLGTFSISGLNNLVGSVSKNKYKVYADVSGTAGSIFAYIYGDTSIWDLKYQFQEAHMKFVHPLVDLTNPSSNVGAVINVVYTDGTNSNVLVNTSIFTQSHSTSHKLALEFNVFTIPHKVLGSIDYYCDDVFVKRYDVNISTEKEIMCINSLGAYFNTGTSQKTCTIEGILRTNNNASVV